ncbi:hypothetical protein [uncultured Bifidobacterium sp.]|uniref:hypothetical protein n=1 Tax=uncultured Bifidobacterium sp. TaxID=165187 RepID=UPI00258D1F90|nr:hypothetical protein [uncultured Bifidobacterium sp.]
MRLQNLYTPTRDQYSISDSFKGQIDGNRFTATEDGQQIYPFMNIPETGIGDVYVMLASDISGTIKAATDNNTTWQNGLCITRIRSWGIKLLMSKGACMTFVMRGSYSETDWRIMQSLHVDCFDSATAPY